jgi:hypothetical protein
MISLKRISRVALGALILGLGAAPSCTPIPVGETMIVLQTDLSLPKDVNKVTIEVLVRGDRRHFNTFEKLGDASSLQIPASLGLTLDVGTDASTPVTFRVTAFEDTKARVLREVVTTIPKDRLVALKMPIQWLCWDQVSPPDAEGNVASSCGEGKTCIAGSCADNKVDPASLDDYSADQIFGGGTGSNGDGTCFDVASCFDQGTDSPLVPSANGDCIINATEDTNVAIRVASAGICGEKGCFVPLDAKSEFGWQPGLTSGTLKLPAAVCDRISNTHTASGVSVLKASTSCPLKTNGIPACGPWSSAGKAPPDPASKGPLTLATNQDNAVSLQVDNKSVYWTNAGTYDATDGAVKSVLIGGGKITIHQSQRAFPSDIAIDRGTTGDAVAVFWASNGTTKANGTVEGRNLLKNTDLAFTIPSPQAPNGVWFLGAQLFVTDFTAGAVYQVDTATNTPSILASSTNSTIQNNPYRIVADAKTAFWTNEVKKDTVVNMITGGAIMSCDLADPIPIAIATNEDLPRNLALGLDRDMNGAATKVYWANYVASGEVVQAERSGTTWTRTVVAAGQAQPYGIAVDATSIYWTNHADGTVMKAPTAGGPAQTIAKGQDLPGAITTDATNVYWINEGAPGAKHSAIIKLSKMAPLP